MKSTNALGEQVGGTHYKDMVFQPIEFILANEIGFCEGNAIKYICRWRTKNGIEDLKKARHYIEMLIQQEERKQPDETEASQQQTSSPSPDRRRVVWDYSWKWVGPNLPFSN